MEIYLVMLQMHAGYASVYRSHYSGLWSCHAQCTIFCITCCISMFWQAHSVVYGPCYFSFFFRVYYSTGRSLMSLWLQNHISHLSLTFFFCHLRIGFLFSLCSLSLSLSLSGGVVTQEAVPRTNQGLVSRDCSVLALETGTHPHTRRVILYTQHPDVKLRVCACEKCVACMVLIAKQ